MTVLQPFYILDPPFLPLVLAHDGLGKLHVPTQVVGLKDVLNVLHGVARQGSDLKNTATSQGLVRDRGCRGRCLDLGSLTGCYQIQARRHCPCREQSFL
jgi:hypothetical protein